MRRQCLKTLSAFSVGLRTRSYLSINSNLRQYKLCDIIITTRRPGLSAVILKAGTLDDPSLFGGPQMAIFTIDKQGFHQIPDGLPVFERQPERS